MPFSPPASTLITLLLTLLFALSNGADPKKTDLVESFSKEDLSLIVMGDTQYHFMCEVSNPPCREASRRCRLAAARPPSNRREGKVSAAHQTTEDDCVAIESRFANRVQRRAIESFVAGQRYPPAALIINGDLTNFGHIHELEEFKAGWMNGFPVPILAGLGNHDYQNNVNDCGLNNCARNMLLWFKHYATNSSLSVDFDDESFTGSFAYAKRICSVTGKQCVHLVQLHNAIDYSVSFTAWIVEQWRMTSPFEFLKRQLDAMRDMDIPILINMHQNEDAREEKLKQLIGDWIYETRSLNVRRRIGIFFAHMHARHEVKTHCFHGVAVPFVYVGSVPNNRFTIISFGPSGDRISGFVARDEKAVLIDSLSDLWDNPCNRSFVHYFHERKPFRKINILD